MSPDNTRAAGIAGDELFMRFWPTVRAQTGKRGIDEARDLDEILHFGAAILGGVAS